MQSLEEVETRWLAGTIDAGIRRLPTLPRLRRLAVPESCGVSRASLASFGPRVRIDQEV